MNKPRFFITDVFTSKKYGGNQLATFVDCESLSDADMQMIAKEMNFSETTFILSREPKNGGYDVRIFTPNSEVEFAGHPTLGTAYVIREKLRLTSDSEIMLNLRVGQIPVTFSNPMQKIPKLWMKQMPPKFGRQYEPNILARILGIDVSDVDAAHPVEEVSTGFPTLVVPLTSLSALKRARVNREDYFVLVKDAWAKLILIYSRESYEPGQSLSVRVFADFYGVAEDAATGSSNGALAAYLAQHNVLPTTNVDVAVGQGYEMGRPSTLELRVSNNNGEIEVSVGGSVVEVAEGVWG